MGATTRWRDTVTTNLDEAVQKLIDDVIPDEKVTNITWSNWQFDKVFESNQCIELNGRKVDYNFIKYSYDQTSAGTLDLEDRVIHQSGFIIAYSGGNGINYIIDQNSSAMKLLRKLLDYSGKNELDRNSFNFNNDFFIWLIYRVYNENYSIEVSSESLDVKLDAIKGFKGDTDDLQTKVSATGETVMNLISTLSFLLESRNMRQVKVDLTCKDHPNISLLLQKNTVKLYLEDYSGIFEQSDNEIQRTAKLYLMVYLEILPMLSQEYNTDIANELWNNETYIKFISDVGKTLKEKIEQKIRSISTEE